MNINQQQALEDEELGIEEEGEDIDYDAVYGGEDIDTTPPEPSKEIKNSYRKIFGDIGKQFTKETLIGAAGTYGDLIELAGPRKEHQLQEPEEVDEVTHGITPIPSSNDLRQVNEAIGGPGEPETEAGRYASRVGKLYGTGAAFGQLNPIPAVLAGAAGQYIEEEGGSPLLQTAAEIAALLLGGGIGNYAKNKITGAKTLVQSAKKEVQQKINNLRNLGYTEEDITLAINSASKGKKGLVNASKGEKTVQAFEDFANRSDEIVNEILSKEIQGVEGGAKRVHELASDAYGEVVDKASNLKINKVEPFFDSLDSAIKEVRKNLGSSKEAKDFIERLTTAGLEAVEKPNADSFINFFKELNSIGNWMERSQKDRIIKNVKNSIKQTFKSEGMEGKKLAEEFERVNAGIQKAFKAEEVIELVDKATTQSGLDYKKLSKYFDSKDKRELFSQVLGEKQAKNIQFISKTGSEIKDFDKSWKAVNSLKGNIFSDAGLFGTGLYFLYQGDLKGLSIALAAKGGQVAAKKISEQFLTNPKFQNLMIKGLNAIKNKSPQTFRAINLQMRQHLKDEGIEMDDGGLDIQ